MFTIENFIHGIANVTKSLKASICGDSLIVNRICYDYETSNDYEELFAQISLEQIQPIIELLADNYICTDKMLIKNDYIEIAVQSLNIIIISLHRKPVRNTFLPCFARFITPQISMR